jgi:hypothetical protein
MDVESTRQSMRREPRNGSEVDAFGPGKLALKWDRGQRAEVKRNCRRRERHVTRTALRTGRY